MTATSFFARLLRPAGLARLLRPAGRGGAAAADDIRTGARFRHVTPRGTVEIARVLGTDRDGFGIRHVSFNLTFHYHDKEVDAGERTLSAAGFLGRYAPFDGSARPRDGAARTRPDGRTEPTLGPPRPPEG